MVTDTVIFFQTLPKWECESTLLFQVYEYSNIKTLPISYSSLDFSFNESVFQYQMEASPKCTVMLLFNLAEPDWISVPCDKKRLYHTLCFIQDTNSENDNNKTSEYLQNTNNYSACSKDHIIIQEVCYAFVWFDGINNTRNICTQFNGNPVDMTLINSIKTIFIAISLVTQFPSLIIQKSSNTAYEITFKRLFSTVHYRYQSANISPTRGFYPCQYDKVYIYTGINLFNCTNGGHILSEYICDGISDCPNDDSDENFCNCDNNSLNPKNLNMCKSMKFGLVKNVCSNLYHMTKKGNCLKYSNISQLLNDDSSSIENTDSVNDIKEVNQFICNDGKTIDTLLLDDLIFDCEPQGEDEPILMSSLRFHSFSSCTEPDMIPCKEGHSRCYYIKDICIYKLNVYNHLVPYRDGGHLQSCNNFECNLMFKCFNSYCILWLYVCDGKWDCPNGDDELTNPVCTNDEVCVFMYNCRNTTRCIHIGNVCNGIKDCFLGDDELYCDLEDYQCPLNCTCLLLAIECRHASNLYIETKDKFYYLSIYASNSKIISFQTLQNKLENVIIVKLPACNLQEFCTH